ncbi:MAG TPA: SDR family NAD(P)-dependent oxidoreductase [Acidimicrobiales bacterium]|jgi:NAD(P)-dependent dehydrogenase (short-subunit alcohol dehydrogenase family)|nr:SDR family NAD(P)-dependent oxidoreductase [Acidimicrobiales bacterium]
MDSITTPFTRESTALEVLEGVDLTGRTAIITGGASGIGLETARALASAGAEVTIAVRDVDAGARAARDILASSGNKTIAVAPLDLTDFASIRSFTNAWLGPVHMLINNAGVMAVPELDLSFDNHEIQFATNHLGHFALTAWLHHSLAAAEGARVVSLSSNAHHFSPVVFKDVDYARRPYDPWTAYGQSKTANILHAVEITRRWNEEGIVANAVHPGAIATNLQRYVGAMRTPIELRKSPAQGASTSVLVAASPLLEGVGGRYFEDCHEGDVTDEPELYGGGVNPWALDVESANQLWELSLSMLDAVTL